MKKDRGLQRMNSFGYYLLEKCGEALRRAVVMFLFANAWQEVLGYMLKKQPLTPRFGAGYRVERSSSNDGGSVHLESNGLQGAVCVCCVTRCSMKRSSETFCGLFVRI